MGSITSKFERQPARTEFAMHKRAVAAERQVPISVGAEGDEFDRVEIIETARRVAEMFITLIVTKLIERRRESGVEGFRLKYTGLSRPCPPHESIPLVRWAAARRRFGRLREEDATNFV